MKKMLPFALLVAGCGGGGSPTPTPAPQAVPDAKVTGQYNLLLTSTNGHGSTTLYTDFTQTDKIFTGASTTLVCPSNDVLQCKGNDPPVTSIIPTGTVNGADVTLAFSYPTAGGANTVSMVGTSSGINLSGTYSDIQGDAGNWTALASGSLEGSYSGTFNSSTTPMSIAPTILFSLTQDHDLNLTGTASFMSYPCISSLTVSGQAIGQAFSLTDPTNTVKFTAVPYGSGFNFSYKFDASAPSCAGDIGHGQVSDSNPWDY